MLRLKTWQGLILAVPIAAVVIFLLVAAGFQIDQWGLNWIWAVFTLIFVAWRFLLVKWTRPVVTEIEATIAEVNAELTAPNPEGETSQSVEEILQKIITEARNDRPIWEDWVTFWQRCQDLVNAIAGVYYPDVKYPLLNIYIPQAYGLIRGTVDDSDRWMQNLSPALNQITIGQAYQAYEVYQKLEPSARKLWQVWNWAQWVINPAAAVAKVVSQKYSDQAEQQLLINLGQVLRENALRNLCHQAVLLYSGTSLAPTLPGKTKMATTTLKEIFAQAEPVAEIERQPVNILLVGRTGAGKSSLINTLFRADLAAVDLLPSTAAIQSYHWQTPEGDELILWDTPGYEQANRADYRQTVLDYAHNADLLILVTPALDPALAIDQAFLKDLQQNIDNLPIIVCVSQVDRLRPLREWQPPYNWLTGGGTKEVNIRECVQYRAELFGDLCDRIFPIVSQQPDMDPWGDEELSIALVESISPAKQLRLARFLENLETRSLAAAKIIDRYTLQMATTQGLTALLKSPILGFISTLATGRPTLAYLLAEQIPVEQLPVVIGKLQMAYELFSLLSPDNKSFDLLALWPVLLENSTTADKEAWAWGHALLEYWTKNLSIEQLRSSYQGYLEQH
jgi:predicted GTPase